MLNRALVYATGALAVTLIGVAGYAWVVSGERDALTERVTVLDGDRTALNADLRACKAANASWQSSLDNVQASLKACVGMRDDVATKGLAAADASREKEARLNAELAAWRQRYRAASASPDCALAMEARLCPAVSDY